ncbi:HNH endonuclease domain-containing protein [Arcticibacterium luteifluviistationis]|uniref:Uncharacterized protein n=1 Tax=Arcticibacterium luteifluviistationis TaxID=1784714 RepID=A0A2Z4GHP0_9BACT|nr:HNH endonuclease domain-containing protein [Arcticibacterium luteifluviistationis]AWW00449.1 hypothetical protein DJ013_20620 [Arcticibacterium luteifluviistationis]
MIKIQEHLNRTDAEAFLDGLALKHWEELNKKLANGKGFKQNSLIEKCKKYREKTECELYREEYAKDNLAFAKRQKSFFDFLLAKEAKELKRIVISRPISFSAIKADIFSILEPNDLFTGTPGNYSQTPFGKLLSETIFNYAFFRGSEFCKELFKIIGFESATCPYCNDNKLNIVKLRSNSSAVTKLKAYLDLDHFYPKSLNPFFAVSFFNLVPSCHDCNSGDKGDKPFSIETHINPYHEAFDDNYKFRISLTVLLGDPLDCIEIQKINSKLLDITLNDLNLNARYANHFETANQLVDLFWKNKKHVGTEFENDFKELLLKDIAIDRKSILKHQRAKMNRDILRQIDIDNILNII